MAFLHGAPYGWPVFDDGTRIVEGDEVLDQNGAGFVAHIFRYDKTGWNIGSGHGYGTHNFYGVFTRANAKQMEEYYKKWPNEKPNEKRPERTTDSNEYIRNCCFGIDDVNHPNHYNNGRVECIDWIEEMLTPEEFKGYLKGCALKYQFRCENKEDAHKDLGKAQWYISKLKARLS